MFKEKTIYILSPHIDDSFFSLWYLINNLYKKWYIIKVINIFTKTNFLLDKLDNNAENIRIEEEKKLLSKYKNIDFINLWFKDAILRGYDKNLIFSLQHFLKDKNIILELKEFLNNFFKDKENYNLFIPIWFWNHIDHILISQNFYYWKNVYYYEDLPYSSRNFKKEYWLYNITKMKKILFDFINNEDLEEHLDNIKFYKTQLSNKHYQEILNYIKNNKLWIWIKNIY